MLNFLLVLSIVFNVILLIKNSQLKSTIDYMRKIIKSPKEKVQFFSEFENDLNNSIILDDNAHDLDLDDAPNFDVTKSSSQENEWSKTGRIEDKVADKVADIVIEKAELPKTDQTEFEQLKRLNEEVIEDKESLLSSLLQSVSGWHKNFIPFLLQNIGWFVGVLCFISGSIFFVSYTQGFVKSITIFYTIFSYTILLALGGYQLKKKIVHAKISGMVLLAISFLLIPLNFVSATRLLLEVLFNEIPQWQFMLTIGSIILLIIILFYLAKFISGLYNRQLLKNYAIAFYLLCLIQLMIPIILLVQDLWLGSLLSWSLDAIILSLFFLVFVLYLPKVLKCVFVERHYLSLFSMGALIFATLVSLIHIYLSMPTVLSISYYAPFLFLLSMTLFYMDSQLNDYKQDHQLLSYLSFIAYGTSFLAIALSLDSFMFRTVVMGLSVVLYLRLLWTYQSLVPLYLAVIVSSLWYSDLFVWNPEQGLIAPLQSLYLSFLPLLIVFMLLLFRLEKAHSQSEKELTSVWSLTRHLWNGIYWSQWILASLSCLLMTNSSQWLLNSLLVISSSLFLLKSDKIQVRKLLSKLEWAMVLYAVLLIPIAFILTYPELSPEVRLTLIVLLNFAYSFNAIYHMIKFYSTDIHDKKHHTEIFINCSLILSIVVLVLLGLGFSIDVKIILLLSLIALNSLFLSFKLYNRGLFYIFLALLSAAIIVAKLLIHSSNSSGLLVISTLIVLFVLLRWFELSFNQQRENRYFEKIQTYCPEYLLGFIPLKMTSPHSLSDPLYYSSNSVPSSIDRKDEENA